MVGFLDFLRNTAGLADQQHLKDLFMQFCQEVGTVPVGVAVRGSLLSLSMGEKLLRMHMKTEADAEKAKQIAAALNSNFFDHGYPVSRTEAREIGLKVQRRTLMLNCSCGRSGRIWRKSLKCDTPSTQFTSYREDNSRKACCLRPFLI